MKNTMFMSIHCIFASVVVVETNKMTLMLFPPPFIGVKIKSPYCPVI